MKYIKGKTSFYQEKPSAVTLGKFDGLHRGHQELIQRMKQAKGGLESLAFTFDVPPVPGAFEQQTVLTTNEERAELMRELGVDTLIECPFVPEIAGMEAEDFLEKILIGELKCREIFVGPDFRFGHNRRGDAAFLAERQKTYGYRLTIVDKVCQDGMEISSTRIRSCLMEGKLKEANQMLGRPYFYSGEVVHGNHLGRTLGFPTANILSPEEKVLLPFGVYAVTLTAGGKRYPAIANIGRKPTIECALGQSTPVGIETYVFDFSEELYGRKIQVDFHEFIRPERTFADLESLKLEIQKNEKQARQFFYKKELL